MRVMKSRWIKVRRYDGEGAGGEGAGEGEGGGNTPPPKTFTQAELDKIVTDRVRKMTEKNKEVITELETLKQNVKLTQEERDSLNERIEQLQNQHLTKEELAAKAAEKKDAEFQSQLTSATESAKGWEQRYTTNEIHRSLTDAAVESEALKPHQIVAILKPVTKVVPVLDDKGAPTGEYKSTVTVTETKDGKSKTLEMSPSEAVKWMRDNEDYWNLFKSTAKGGMGGQGGSTGKGSPPPDFSNPEAYRKWRAANPNADPMAAAQQK